MAISRVILLTFTTVHEVPIPASESKQHRRVEFHQLRDVPLRHALVDHPRTVLKSSGLSSIPVPPALSHGSILISFLCHTPYVAHLLEYAVIVSRTSKVFSQGVPHVADKKDLSAPLATEPQAHRRSGSVKFRSGGPLGLLPVSRRAAGSFLQVPLTAETGPPQRCWTCLRLRTSARCSKQSLATPCTGTLGRYPDFTTDQREDDEADFFVEVRDDASCQHAAALRLARRKPRQIRHGAVSLDTMPDTGVIASEDSEANVVEEYVSLTSFATWPLH